MDERRCVEVLREMLQYTMGTGVLVDEEREALDHAIATIERVAASPVVEITDCNNPIRQLPGNPLDVTWADFPTFKARIVREPDPQPDGQEG